MLIVPATEAPAEPQMHLLKASLRPWPPQRVSGGTREAGRKSGARVQDTGFCSSNSDCGRRGHWTLRTPGRTHRAVSGDAGRGQARAPPMPGKKSKQRNAHLERSVSLSHFLCSQQLVGSLESRVQCLLTDTAGKGKAICLPQTICPADSGQACKHTCAHTCIHTCTPSMPIQTGFNSMVISPEECWPWPPSARHLWGESAVSSLRKPGLHEAVAHMGSASGKYRGNASRPRTTYHDHSPPSGRQRSLSLELQTLRLGASGGEEPTNFQSRPPEGQEPDIRALSSSPRPPQGLSGHIRAGRGHKGLAPEAQNIERASRSHMAC